MAITTLGQVRIKNKLPKDLNNENMVLDKKGLFSLLNDVARKHPGDYAEITKFLKDLGDQAAFETGSSFSLNDIRPVDVDKYFKEFDSEYFTARKIKDKVKQHDAFRQINKKVDANISTRIKQDLKTPNDLTLWITTGSKGSPDDLKQIAYTMGNVVNLKKEVFPFMARSSLARGLSPSDFYIGAVGARKGATSSFKSVRDPGAFAKELYTLTNDLIITTNDCGTHEGFSSNINEQHIIDRCLLEDVGNFKRNDVVTNLMVEALKRQGISTIKVRTPSKCEATEGICQKCIGLLENGKLSYIGDTVGLRSSQAATEPHTQWALKEKHTGGVANQKTTFETFKQLMHVPENFPGAAVLSNFSGTIHKVEKTPDNGTRVHIGNNSHYLTPRQTFLGKLNQDVKIGDKLSDGLTNPAELISLTEDMTRGRNHLANELQGLYEENGIKAHPKLFETIVKGVLNFGEVTDPGTHDYNIGDIVRWNQVQPLTRKIVEKKRTLDSTNHSLNTDFPQYGLRAGKVLSYDDINLLHNRGYDTIEVYKEPLKVKPIMISTDRAAMYKGSWLSNLGYRHVKNRLLDNIAEARSSNLHSTDPIPAYVSGEIGYGKDGTF